MRLRRAAAAPTTPCTTSPVLPDVLDRRSVQPKVDRRRVDAGAVVGRDHGHAQHVAIRRAWSRRRARATRTPAESCRARRSSCSPRRDCRLRRPPTTTACALRRRARAAGRAVARPATGDRDGEGRRHRPGPRSRRVPLSASANASSTGRSRVGRDRAGRDHADGGRRAVDAHRERKPARLSPAHVGPADGTRVDAVAERRCGQAQSRPGPTRGRADTASPYAARTSPRRCRRWPARRRRCPTRCRRPRRCAQTSSRCQAPSSKLPPSTQPTPGGIAVGDRHVHAARA